MQNFGKIMHGTFADYVQFFANCARIVHVIYQVIYYVNTLKRILKVIQIYNSPQSAEEIIKQHSHINQD